MIKDKFDEIIKETVKPLMKEKEYRKIGLTFYKEKKDLIYMINIQKSTHNNYEKISFYINCCIHSKQMDEILDKEIKTRPKHYQCYYRKRIESILENSKKRYTITSDTEKQELQKELKSNIRQAVEYLEITNTLDKLIKLMIKQNGLHNYREILLFLLKTSKADYTKMYIKKLYQDFNKDNRWMQFEQQIIEILESNKSDLNMSELI